MITIPPEVIAAIVGGMLSGFFGLCYRGLRLLGWYLREREVDRRAQLPPEQRAPVSQPPDLGPVVLLIGVIGAGTAAGYAGGPHIAALSAQAGTPSQRCNPAACKRAGGECRGGVCTKAAEDGSKPHKPPRVSAAMAVIPVESGEREPI